MATITLQTPDGETTTFECDEETPILEAAEEAGVDHPDTSINKKKSSCCMKLVDGTVNQEDQFFLDDDQLESGFVLTCVALPSSATITLLTEQEENL